MRIRARTKNLQVQVLEHETLVYDPLDGGACHVLNQTAASVWKLCDGRRTMPELARALAADTGLPADTQIIELALVDLRKARLVVEELDADEVLPSFNVDRRALIKKLGLGVGASLLLPVVDSMLAPLGFASGQAYAAGVTTLAFCAIPTMPPEPTAAAATTAAATTAAATTAVATTRAQPKPTTTKKK